jgi:large subunit ribosomal protein L6
MTRKGRLPIPVPNGIEVKVENGAVIVKGAKGQLRQDIIDGVVINVEEGKVLVSVEENSKDNAKFHGLYRTLVHNMVLGLAQGFEKRLEMIGVGYRANVQGSSINLQVGFSHPTLIPIPEGIEIQVEKNTQIIIRGIDKQKVGQFAAKLRSIRPPEPYQGKGIRYHGEFVRRKAGKSAAKK